MSAKGQLGASADSNDDTEQINTQHQIQMKSQETSEPQVGLWKISKIEILNIFSYAMPMEEAVEKFCLLNKASVKCVNIFDKAFQRMFSPEVSTMAFDFSSEFENIHSGQVTSLVKHGDRVLSG